MKIAIAIIVALFALSVVIDWIQSVMKERKRVKKARQRQSIMDTLRNNRR